jgi:predicted RNase H-like HicB family nuclease
MSKLKKTLTTLLEGRSDANFDFGDLCFLLARAGFTPRQGKGSHHIYFKVTCNRAARSRNLTKSNKSATSSSNTNSTSTDMRYELIIYWSKTDESFIVEVPELPGCMADGATYEAAVANARVVVQDWIDTAKSLGRTIPEPRGKLAYA